MAQDYRKPSDFPFVIKTDTNGTVVGFDLKEDAEARCKWLNEKAEKLGLKTRYKVIG